MRSHEGDQTVEYHHVVVHHFNLGFADYSQLHEVVFMSHWHDTDSAKWLMQHTVKPLFYFKNQRFDGRAGFDYDIVATLSDADRIYWMLKWG